MRSESRPYFNARPMLCLALGGLCGVLCFCDFCPFLNWLFVVIAIIVAGAGFCFGRRMAALFALGFAMLLLRTALCYPFDLPQDRMCVISGRVIVAGQRPVIGDLVLNSEPCSFYLQINADVELSYGDRISTHGYVRFTSNMQDSYKSYYNSRNIFATTRIKRPNVLPAGDESAINSAMNSLARLRTEIEGRIDGSFKNSAFIKGMLLGDSSDIDPDAKSAVQSAGVAHILALSGLHVTIIAGCLAFLLRFCNRWLRFSLLAIFLLAFAAMTGFSPSLCRACVMFLCYSLAKNIRRRPDSLSALCAAFLAIVCVNPFAVHSASMALSFGAMLGILLVSSTLQNATAKLPLKAVTGSMSVSVGASLGTFAPFSAFFSRVPVLSPLANLFAIPVATAAIVSSFFGVALSFVIPSLILPLAFVADLAVDLLLHISNIFASIPFSVLEVPALPLAIGALVVAGMTLVSPYFLRPWRTKLVCAGIVMALAALAFALI